ncbi:hypothetical protein [Chengkuizengella axinellae]|uniref:Uncharacterized protein n=1 Tax=Chengkuizengella axinellae TaxID=3064388 RepID=A0ABT9IZM9_9BACL|nr:hypothetical protein [Chengkuizengella sp. 2205SS18-9]MDP5274230.1 hypothetical protein [Chengkuizengella sp. 2205SS18-9]
MSNLFFTQSNERIEIPANEEFMVALELEVPRGYKNQIDKIDTFFELQILQIKSHSLLLENEPCKVDINYQVFSNDLEVTPVLSSTLNGERVTLLTLTIPNCFNINLFKIDAFFELSFFIEDNTNPDEAVLFIVDVDYQLFDGIGENAKELTPLLAETISGTASFSEQFKIDFESNTMPNLTIVAESLTNNTLYLVANLKQIEGEVFIPFIRFHSMNAVAFPKTTCR